MTREYVTWPIRRSRNSEEDLFVGEDYFRRKIGFRSGRVVGVDADVAAFDLDTNEEFVKDQEEMLRQRDDGLGAVAADACDQDRSAVAFEERSAC